MKRPGDKVIIALIPFLEGGIKMLGKSCHINSSSKDDIVKSVGIGENEASRLVDYRSEHGPFRSIDDLMNVPGFGPSTVDKLKSECDLD